jgi:glycosyltransferase involved in cell wall biosynthesis
LLGDRFDPARIHTSFLQRFPKVNHYFRALAPLYPRAFEAFDLRAYDTIVSSTTSWAKGVIARPGALHVCYINTVSRFAFDYERYVGGFGIGTLARPLIDRLVLWDKRAAARPTLFVANSHNVATRVREYYGRESRVLPCPVDVDRFTVGAGDGDYAIVISRLLPYKKIDRAIAGAALAGIPLRVLGTGPAEASLRELARGTQTTFYGYLSDAERNAMLGAARFAILPGEEDFGLVPLEAAAAGRPTVALGRGGALETIVAGVTGTFFSEPTSASLAAVLRTFDPAAYDPQALRAHAQTFAPERFIERLRAIVHEARELL